MDDAEKRAEIARLQAELGDESASAAPPAKAAPRVVPPPATPAPGSQAAGWGCLIALIGMGLAIVLIIGGFIWVAIFGPSEPEASEGGAVAACENFVEDRLKSPSSADFSGTSATPAVANDSRWTVTGSVDAENSFGASIRSSFTCTIGFSKTTGDYLLVSITGLN